MDWVKTTDLIAWADTRNCQSELPALVRRLIRATTKDIRTIVFPSGENVQIGGWDGYLDVEQGNEFVTDGISVWEFGALKPHSTKAKKDYAKRKADSLGVDPKQATFVFVTPRIWKKSEEWAQNKRSEGYWKDVKVITAEKLEEWIETAPSVGFWLAITHLNKYPSTDILTTEKFWEEWSSSKGEERLLPSLLLSGREQTPNDLIERCIENNWVGVRSISQEESMAFIVASFMVDEAYADDFFSRSLIVSSRDAFRSLEVSAIPLILIPRFVDLGLFNTAAQRGHSVIVPLGAEDNGVQEAIINLDEIDRDGFVNSLKESGYKHAEQLSIDTARNIGVLRRRLGFEGTKPKWAVPENIRTVIPAISVGRWQNYYEGDKEILSSVAGIAYDDYISSLSLWMISSDPPIMKIEDYWRLTSPYDAFFYSYPYWTQQDFNRLENAVIQVFSETDGSIQKKELSNDLLTQLRNQSTNRYSHAIREGLLMTLILMAEYGTKVNNPSMGKPQEWVDDIIMRVLLNSDQYFWKTISDHLPLIAEASPNSFLNRIEALQDDSITGLFPVGESGDPFFHRNYSTGLLWALESLAWESKYLARVSNILLALSKIPIAPNIGNKPINSLKEIFQPWHCQTFSTYEEQKQVLQLLFKQNSEIAWRLLIYIMPDPHGGISLPTHRMRWRSFGRLRDKYYQHESNDMWNFVFDLLLSNTDNRADRFSDLIDISANIGVHNRIKLFENLQQNKEQVNDEDAVLWNQLRKFIHRHREFPDADWSFSEEALFPYLEMYSYLIPKDILKKNLWIFDDHRIEMANPKPASERHRENWWEESLEFRRNALLEICEQVGLEGVLEGANQVKEPSLLGETLAYAIPGEEIVRVVRYCENHRLPSDFIRNLFLRLNCIKSDEEIFDILNSLDLNNLSVDIAGDITTALKQTTKYWSYIESLNQSLMDAYWNTVRLTLWGGSEDDIIYGVQKLFDYKRYSSAIQFVQMLLVSLKTIPSSILEECLLGLVFENKGKFLPSSYDITHILEELDKRDDVEDLQMIRIELFTILLYRGEGYSPKRVFKALSEDVGFCMEMLRWKWIHDEEKDASLVQFRIANEILEQFNIIPGMREEGTIDGAILNNWVNTLRNTASDAGILKYADCLIGELFATYPRKTEGYPPVEICEIIERLHSMELNQHFSMKIYNSRGTTVRGAFDGGALEQREANYYTLIAEKHRNTHPAVCIIFECLANSLLRDGARHDYQAKIDLLEY